MPTYVYRGLETGTTFEVQQRITEDALTHHPETGEPVARVIQAAGVVFKGSGFYKTDSRQASKAGGEAKPEKEKAEAKPAASSPAPAAAD